MERRWILRGFYLLEAVLYAAFLLLDLRGEHVSLSGVLKYTGVLLCLLLVTVQRGDRWIGAGLAFTACADWFLLFTDHFLPGVCLFLCVQFCYSVWLERQANGQQAAMRREVLWRIGRRFAGKLFVAAVILLGLARAGVAVDGVLAVAAVYFLFLLENTGRAMGMAARAGSAARVRSAGRAGSAAEEGREAEPGSVARQTGFAAGKMVFAAGMVLFVLCDIQVGVYNMGAYLPGMGEGTVWHGIASVGMWACYLPAKACIAVSACLGKGAGKIQGEDG